jgi:elongation factor 1-alpha
MYLYFLFKVHRRTGKSTDDAPKFIKSGDAAIVTLILSKRLLMKFFLKHRQVHQVW